MAGFCYFMIGGRVLPARGGAARIWRGQVVPCATSRHARGPAGSRFSSSRARACLHLQTYFLRDWHSAFNIQGPGGWVGYYFGGTSAAAADGSVGSIILLTGLYVTSIILMTGLRPIHIVRQTVAGMRDSVAELREWRLHAALAQGGLKGPAGDQPSENSRKQQRTIEKQLKKQGRAGREAVASFIARRNWPSARSRRWSTPPRCLGARRRAKNPHWPNCAGARKQAKRSAWSNELQRGMRKITTLPGLDLLDEHDVEGRVAADPAELERIQQTLIETLAQFGIAVAPGDITKGPTITRYEVYPAKGVRVDKIVSLERDLARATRAERINILAPIPGKDTVGIELANSRKVKVTLRELMQSPDWTRNQGEAADRARQGRLRQNDHRRPRADAAPARRRHHRQRQERLHQRAHREHALPLHPGGTAFHHDRSESGRDAGLQCSAAPRRSGRDRSEEGAARACAG